MAVRSVSFWDDAPVGLNGDKAWTEGHVVRQRVDELANMVLGAKQCLTIGIHGPWGSGRTSFLKMVEEQVHKLRPKLESEPVVFCQYLASSYQDLGPAAATLAYRMLLALKGLKHSPGPDEFMDGRHWLAIINDELKLPHGAAGRKSGLEGALDTPRRMQDLSQLAVQVADFDQILSERLRSPVPQRLVVLLDDLDRCRVSFIVDVLLAAQRLSTVDRLIFLVAVDRAVLSEAMQQHCTDITLRVDHNRALEKYIQYSIRLPALGVDEFNSLVDKLFEGPVDGAMKALKEQRVYLGSLLVGRTQRTPRAVKGCLRAITPQLADDLKRLEESSDPDERREVVQKSIKEGVLAQIWPDVYEAVFLPAKTTKFAPEMAFVFLESVCRTYERNHARDREVLDFELSRLRRWAHAVGEVSDELAEFLGRPPFWATEEVPVIPATQPVRQPGVEVPQATMATMSLFEKAMAPAASDRPADVFHRMYVQCEAAKDMGDLARCRALLTQTYQFLRSHREDIRNANRIGDLASTADNIEEHKLAEQLYRLALEYEPAHVNNRINFVQYILAHRYDLRSEAQSILEQLFASRLQPAYLHRALMLRALLATQDAMEPGTAAGDDLQALWELFSKEPNNRQILVSLVVVASSIGDYKTCRIAVAAFLESNLEPDDQMKAMELLADTLYNSDDPDDEFEAMDLYRMLIAALPEKPGLRANYAALLDKYDYEDEAGRQWFEGYRLEPNEHGIQRAYSQYLLREGHPELADRVVRGLAVTDCKVAPHKKPLPSRFSKPRPEDGPDGGDGSPRPPRRPRSTPSQGKRRSSKGGEARQSGKVKEGTTSRRSGRREV